MQNENQLLNFEISNNGQNLALWLNPDNIETTFDLLKDVIEDPNCGYNGAVFPDGNECFVEDIENDITKMVANDNFTIEGLKDAMAKNYGIIEQTLTMSGLWVFLGRLKEENVFEEYFQTAFSMSFDVDLSISKDDVTKSIRITIIESENHDFIGQNNWFLKNAIEDSTEKMLRDDNEWVKKMPFNDTVMGHIYKKHSDIENSDWIAYWTLSINDFLHRLFNGEKVEYATFGEEKQIWKMPDHETFFKHVLYRYMKKGWVKNFIPSYIFEIIEAMDYPPTEETTLGSFELVNLELSDCTLLLSAEEKGYRILECTSNIEKVIVPITFE